MITVITPTCNRPVGMALLERWMARQTVQPDRWIVADGGDERATLTMGQEHSYVPSDPGARNFAQNVHRALMMVGGSDVILMEDDDWYAPDHIESCMEALKTQDACGSSHLRYYNLRAKAWVHWRNCGASLAQTGFRASLTEAAISAAKKALAVGDYTIDGRFWAPMSHLANTKPTSVGIKGMPGAAGLGQGHRPDNRWTSDHGGEKLREWIGVDAYAYL